MLSPHEQELLRRAPTTAVVPAGMAHCGVRHRLDDEPAWSWTCTLWRGHVGPHIAHDLNRLPLAVWEEDKPCGPSC